MRLRFLPILLLTCYACELTTQQVSAMAGAIQVRNNVNRCLGFSIEDTVQIDDFIAMRLRKTRRASLAECGCKHNVLEYSVSEVIGLNDEREEIERVFGRFNADAADSDSHATLILATDKELWTEQNMVVEIRCGRAD